jgi:predicted RNA-binding protein associated with RNAse of E/G family
MSEIIVVHKLDETGQEVWRYPGRILVRGPHSLMLAAEFDRERTQAGSLTIEPGDRFIETFYDDRWYNVFAVHSQDGSVFRGWYCNIARPAVLDPADVYQQDLALDLIVLPGGEVEVLDRDEFEEIDLPASDRANAESTLAELIALAEQSKPPFRSQTG